MRILLAALCAIAAASTVACGSATRGDATRTASVTVASPSAVATGTRTPVTTVTAAPSRTPAPIASATPEPAGDTGIDGMVTLGPMCPVERPESPCPDKPYAARMTIWRGGTKVAETRSSDDGRFRVVLPAGTYRIVGETEGTFPRGSEVEVTVVAGQMTPVQIQYDTGIR